MSFDDQLRRALNRQPAPPDFVERVLSRLESRGAPPAVQPRRELPVRWLTAVAASVMLAIAGGRLYVQRQTAAEAERVQQEIGLALQIAAEKLELVQRKLHVPVK
jgi:hypothetical protein